jgi:hypothetical protein
MAQPKKNLDYSALDALLQFKVSCNFCADYLGVSRDTIVRRIKEDHGLTFSEYHQLKKERTATKLQQKAIELALKGNSTMMIFCLKNLAGWSDKQEIEQTSKVEITIDDDESKL